MNTHLWGRSYAPHQTTPQDPSYFLAKSLSPLSFKGSWKPNVFLKISSFKKPEGFNSEAQDFLEIFYILRKQAQCHDFTTRVFSKQRIRHDEELTPKEGMKAYVEMSRKLKTYRTLGCFPTKGVRVSCNYFLGTSVWILFSSRGRGMADCKKLPEKLSEGKWQLRPMVLQPIASFATTVLSQVCLDTLAHTFANATSSRSTTRFG